MGKKPGKKNQHGEAPKKARKPKGQEIALAPVRVSDEVARSAAGAQGATAAAFFPLDTLPKALGQLECGRTTVPVLGSGRVYAECSRRSDGEYDVLLEGGRRATLPADVVEPYIADEMMGLMVAAVRKSHGMLLAGTGTTEGRATRGGGDLPPPSFANDCATHTLKRARHTTREGGRGGRQRGGGGGRRAK
jgi:hypothetical protein